MDMGGMSSMRASGSVVIPAHGSVVFTPGGRHLMIMGVKGGLKPGQTVRMTFAFAHAGRVTVPFVARN
jgi:copper(I)-binding protein